MLNDTDHLWGHTGGDNLGVEELLPRAERALHGGTTAFAHVAGFGPAGHGAGVPLRREDKPGRHEAR